VSSSIYADFLPLVLLGCLIEMDGAKRREFLYNEMVAVFSSVDKRNDVKDSCQFIFSFFADVEKILTTASDDKKVKSPVRLTFKIDLTVFNSRRLLWNVSTN
jgi:hypothetical protein